MQAARDEQHGPWKRYLEMVAKRRGVESASQRHFVVLRSNAKTTFGPRASLCDPFLSSGGCVEWAWRQTFPCLAVKLNEHSRLQADAARCRPLKLRQLLGVCLGVAFYKMSVLGRPWPARGLITWTFARKCALNARNRARFRFPDSDVGPDPIPPDCVGVSNIGFRSRANDGRLSFGQIRALSAHCRTKADQASGRQWSTSY